MKLLRASRIEEKATFEDKSTAYTQERRQKAESRLPYCLMTHGGESGRKDSGRKNERSNSYSICKDQEKSGRHYKTSKRSIPSLL